MPAVPPQVGRARCCCSGCGAGGEREKSMLKGVFLSGVLVPLSWPFALGAVQPSPVQFSRYSVLFKDSPHQSTVLHC